MPRLVLASNNAGKLREFSDLFAPLGITLIAQGELGVPEAPEPHVTFVENAPVPASSLPEPSMIEPCQLIVVERENVIFSSLL